MTNVSARHMMNYLKTRSQAAGCRYSAEPIFNSDAAANGAPLVVMGYALRGPRGNRYTLPKNSDDTYSLDAVKLWCDGVEYATSKIKARRAN